LRAAKWHFYFETRSWYWHSALGLMIPAETLCLADFHRIARLVTNAASGHPDFWLRRIV
jgi:hypothetical protein